MPHRPTDAATTDGLGPIRWDDAPDALLGFATRDLDTDVTPLPTLLAFAGPEPIAIATLRPFGSGEALQALIELLALLLPVGADRVAVSLPGRAWSTEDPVVPVCEDGDLRTHVLVIVTADANASTCRVEATVHPWERTGGGWAWSAPVPAERPVAPLVDALELLLGARDELDVDDRDDRQLAVQFARVLLLGHQLWLAPAIGDEVQRATLA